MAYPNDAIKSTSVRNVSELPDYITMCNKTAEMVNNKWREYGLD